MQRNLLEKRIKIIYFYIQTNPSVLPTVIERAIESERKRETERLSHTKNKKEKEKPFGERIKNRKRTTQPKDK